RPDRDYGHRRGFAARLLSAARSLRQANPAQVKSVFLDTSFLLALVLRDDEHHERALALQKRIAGPFVTTEYVLLELADALSGSADLRRVALACIEMLRRDA